MALLLAVGVTALFWSFRQVEKTAEMRKQSFVVLSRASALLSPLKDAETGMRGYLLTGDEAFLKPYLAVRTTVAGHLEDLHQLVLARDSHKVLDAMDPLVAAHLAKISEIVEVRRSRGMTAALAVVRDGQGKMLMDSIRAGMNSFTQMEERELARHDAEVQKHLHRMFVLIVAAGLLALLFALSFALCLYREGERRLKDLLHLETRHLLEIQEETNGQLQQANAKLLVSEEKLAVTLMSIGDAVIATDGEGRVTFLNPIAERLTGWTQAEAAGRLVDEVFHIINKETRQPSTIPVKGTLAHGTIQGLANHTVLIARDGRECDIADSCAPIRDRDGHVIGAVLVFRDVTSEYAVQQALRDSSALVNTILDTVADGIITLRAGGVIETVNPAAERMFGYNAAELIGEKLGLLIPELGLDPADGNGFLEYYGASAEERAVAHGREVQGRRKDGGVFPMEMAASEMWLGGERYFTGILRDITARKEIEAEQKQLAQRVLDSRFYSRSLFESSIDALLTTSSSGMITDVNRQMQELTGCTRNELIGSPFKDHFTDPDLADTSIGQVLRERKVRNFELTARARDGRETAVSFNATTFYDRNRVLLGVYAAARDVTERKRLDRPLMEKNVEPEGATHVADRANLAKSDFLSSMSHELRIPLNAILGFAQLMESDTPPPTSSQKERIAQILEAGWHLLTLINEILDLAKVESGQTTLSMEPVSLEEVMLECRGMIEQQAQQRGIRMVFPHFDTPSFAMADRTRLKQVLLNLLSNAVKYNSENGTVEVNYAGSGTGRIRISISDTGAGLSASQTSHLFQSFDRLGPETGGEEGTGIGLVLAKRLVEMMNGDLGVESTVGVGSVFWFELDSTAEPRFPVEGRDAALPLIPGERSHAAESAPPSVPREERRHTLLYVEDNPANLKLVEQIIARRPDIRLLTAASGERGVDIARASLPDVILMDINLPDINGYQALVVLRSDPATARIPVIALSANAMPFDENRGLKAGFFRYMTKPIKVNEFVAAMDEALAHVENRHGPMA